MKLNRWFGLALATLVGLGAGSVLAQNNDNGGQSRGQNGFGGRGFRNMDPAQRQQMMMDGIKSELEITDDSEWNALQPLVKKVMDAQQAVVGERMRGFFGRPRGGGDNGGGGDQGGQRRGGGPGGMFGQPSPEAEALQRAVDSKASTAETKAALAKLIDARKNSQASLEKAQADLRKVLTVRQEAILTLRGLL